MAGALLGLSALLFSLTVLLVARRELRALVTLTPKPLSTPLTVVIPARDEPDIASCMERALADPHPALRVVVVDDRSTDDTASRAQAVCDKDERARLVRLADDPPPGVFGKPRALHEAMEHVHTDEVLFLDADVLLERGALGALVEARARAGADALSGVPRLVTRTTVEELLVPTIASVVTSRFLPTQVHDARAPAAFLNGQLILTTRAALTSAGGWQAVQGTVLEDVALAKRLKAAGRALRLADVRALASTRMYAGLGEIVEGFGKNAVALIGPSAGVIGAFSFVSACMPWMALALALVSPDPLELSALAVLGAVGSFSCAVVARRLAGAPLWPALALPLAYLGVTYVLVRASVAHARRAPVVWKGRAYGG